MQPMYYIGLGVHKRKISYCVKDGSGAMHAEGTISATRLDLDLWMKTLPQPWSAAMEATMFTGWIYDHLRPHAAALKVVHPLMLRAETPLISLGPTLVANPFLSRQEKRMMRETAVQIGNPGQTHIL